MPKATIDGVRIHYQQTGRGPDLVLLHGLASDHAFWFLRFIPALRNRWRVTVYDLRGHGYSDAPPSGYSTRDMARDLEGLLDHLGIDDAHLVGHSFGGAVALHYAALWPRRVRTLAVIDSRINTLQPIPLFGDGAEWRERRERLQARGVNVPEGSPHLVTMLIEEMFELAEGGPPEEVTIPGLVCWKRGGRMNGRLSKLRLETTFLDDVRGMGGLTQPLIREIAVPTLLSYGERSRCLESCRALEKCLPHHRTVIHPGLGHFFPALKPDLLLADLQDFHDDTGVARAASGAQGVA
jgi:pimeloyl-ACP methyl ester carboxylesterase